MQPPSQNHPDDVTSRDLRVQPKVTDLFPYPVFEWAGLKLYMGLSEVPMIGTFLIEQSQN